MSDEKPKKPHEEKRKMLLGESRRKKRPESGMPVTAVPGMRVFEVSAGPCFSHAQKTNFALPTIIPLIRPPK